MKSYSLELRRFKIRDVQFGNATAYANGVLTIKKSELLKAVASERLRNYSVDIARPGESVRIIPVKDVIEPRVKVESGKFFPGILAPCDCCGTGATVVLDGCNVVTTGQIVFYQEGLIDMSGPGAKYTIYSKTCNVVLSADPTDDLTHAEHEREIRMAGLKAAEYLASCVRDSKADLTETWELDSHDSSKPRIGYVYLLLAQGLLHDNYLYGNNIRTVHPCILHPNELMDGAVVSGNCVTACDKNTTYDHPNNPVLKELYERHGKELDFCGVIVSPISPVLEEKERCALGIANLCALLGLDGVIISEEGGGNPESDLMLICRRLEQEGISTVLLAHENCGKDGTAQGITIVTKEADAVVSAGNANEIITLPPMDRVIGVSSAMNQLSGALENSLKPDGSIETTYTVIMDAISNLGIMPLGVETY